MLRCTAHDARPVNDGDDGTITMFVISYSDYLESQAQREPLRSAARTNKQVRAAAARVLERLGFHRMRVSDICKEAKIAQGTFYLHFTDLEHVAQAVLNEFVDMMLQTQPKERAEDPYDYVKSMVEWFFQAFQANVGLYKSLIQLSGEHAAFSQIWDRWNKSMVLSSAEELKRRGAAAGVKDDVLHLTLYLVGGLLDQTLYAIYAFHRSPDLERVAGEPQHLIEIIAVLWHRSLFGCDPDPSKLSTVARHLPSLPAAKPRRRP